ncbi:MAG: hypothetical protein B7Z55_13440 [Planctomycetales bacterium 12-60-4]|nr:MAG: hypothetical protein B7Z55_13440 [Planctomycetales bacterium 12-60-4]
MIDTWRADAKGTGLRIGTDRDQNPNAIQGVVRWADGSRSGRFSDTYESKVAGPIVDQVPQRSSATMSSNLRRRDLWWDMAQFADTGDGEYEFSLKLGENLSAPVRVSIAHGQPSTTRIEFVMPVANPHSGN